MHYNYSDIELYRYFICVKLIVAELRTTKVSNDLYIRTSSLIKSEVPRIFLWLAKRDELRFVSGRAFCSVTCDGRGHKALSTEDPSSISKSYFPSYKN